MAKTLPLSMRKPPTEKPKQNRVWIEVERPFDDQHAQEICAKLNRMIQRLGTPDAPSQEFQWWPEKRVYTFGSLMGYKVLSDDGEWFNLDYFGRE